MAEKKPLVLKNGAIQELQEGDTLPSESMVGGTKTPGYVPVAQEDDTVVWGEAASGDTTVYADTDPTTTTNPDSLDIIWVNRTSGVIFTCTDNTTDANVWKEAVGGIIGVSDIDFDCGSATTLETEAAVTMDCGGVVQ